MGVTVKFLRIQIYKQNLVIKMLNKDSNSEISNANSAALFDPKYLKRCYNDTMKSDEIAETDIMKYLFTECVEVGKRIETKGSAREHRYSRLIIQFACML